LREYGFLFSHWSGGDRRWYHELDLNMLHKSLLEVLEKSAVSVRDNREGVSVNSESLIKEDLGSLFNINILENGKQVCIVTEAIKNNKNEVIFLIT
jgi:hypothetical protein